MPKKPKHPCNYPGCTKLTDGRYCEEHQRLVDQNYNRYERDYTKKHERYGPLWQKIQAMYIREHPLCEQCLQEGRLVAAVHVHHKKPLAEGGTNEISNLIALCKPCHSRIHAKRGDQEPRGRWESQGGLCGAFRKDLFQIIVLHGCLPHEDIYAGIHGKAEQKA